MKLVRRILFWLLVALIVIPFGIFVCGVVYPDSKTLSTALVSLCIPIQVLATVTVLIWSAVFLKVEPGLCRLGILLAVFTLVVVDLFVGS